MRTVSPLLLFLLLRCGPSSGYGGGAPRSQCGSLMPGHGGAAQDTGTSPYEVKVTDETEEESANCAARCANFCVCLCLNI